MILVVNLHRYGNYSVLLPNVKPVVLKHVVKTRAFLYYPGYYSCIFIKYFERIKILSLLNCTKSTNLELKHVNTTSKLV